MALRIPYPQILNELSFVACVSHEEFLSRMQELKCVMDAMNRIGFSYAVAKSHGIYERVCYSGTTFRKWLFDKNALNSQERMLKGFFKIAMSKTPAFEEAPDSFVGYCDFDLFFEGEQIYGGGSTYIPAFLLSYLNRLPSIALNVGRFSMGGGFLLEKHELLESGEIDIRQEAVDVVATGAGAELFSDPVTQRIVKEVHSGQAILDVCENLWPYLSFSDEVIAQLPAFDVANGHLVGDLIRLHSAFEICLNGGSRDLRKEYGSTKSLIMDESDSTKHQYPNSRTFHWNGVRRDCWPHLRLNIKERMHFLPDFDAKKLYIGYVGPHLPT